VNFPADAQENVKGRVRYFWVKVLDAGRSERKDKFFGKVQSVFLPLSETVNHSLTSNFKGFRPYGLNGS
jgi:hypothetical protein